VGLLSIVPLAALKRIPAGPVPKFHESVRACDAFGMIVFAADGWMASGIAMAWPMILFTALGSHYEALGLSNAGAGVLGVVAGLYCGKAIDRGGRDNYVALVSVALAAGIALRALAGWSPPAAAVVNAMGAAVMGFYVPMLMSVMYEGAKRSAGAYTFHFAAEGGWDLGAAAGCIAAAAVAASGLGSSLAVIPSGLAVVALYASFRRAPAGVSGSAH
jgi:hypothetical protein